MAEEASKNYAMLARQLHEAFAKSVEANTGQQIPNGIAFHKPTEEEARFLIDMSKLLVEKHGRGDGTDDILLHVHDAAYSHDPVREVREKFFVAPVLKRNMKDALANPLRDNIHLWPGEKAEPERMAEILRAFHLLEGMTERQVARMNFKPWPPDGDEILPPQGVVVYTGTLDPKHKQHNTAEIQQFDSVTEPLKLKQKPQVYYFSGRNIMSEESGYVRRIIGRIRFALNPQKIPPEKYDLFVVTYDNRASNRKWEDTLNFNVAPETHIGPQADVFVKEYLRPLYAKDATGEQPSPKLFSAAKLKERFSLVTFVGFSYGTVFVQQIRNAMVQDMKGLGYTDDTIAQALPSLAALNLSTTGTLAPDLAPNFTQMHICTKEDITCQAHSNADLLVKSAPDEKYAKHVRLGDKAQPRQIVVQATGMPDKIPFFQDATDEQASGYPHFSIPTPSGKKHFYNDPIYTLDNKEKHHVGSYLTLTGIQPSGKFAVAANPVSTFVTEALQAQVAASLAVSEGKTKSRDAGALLANTADEFLNPKKLSEIARENDKQVRALRARGVSIYDDIRVAR